MDKTKLIGLSGKIAIVAVGVVIGSLVLQYGQRHFAKSDFTKSLDVKKEE